MRLRTQAFLSVWCVLCVASPPPSPHRFPPAVGSVPAAATSRMRKNASEETSLTQEKKMKKETTSPVGVAV